MFLKPSTLLAGAFALTSLAAPLPQPESDTTVSAGTPSLTKEILTAIAPATATCGAQDTTECADAPRAVAALNKSFQTYGVKSTGEQAAIVAYTLFESGNYKYNKNHYPGRPGQGTRMMAMPPFVKQYATSLVGASQVAQEEAKGGDAALVGILDIANASDERSFGSASWFLTTQCSPQIRQGLVDETVEGWHAFLTECVGTTAAPERDTPWLAAKQHMLGSAYGP